MGNPIIIITPLQTSTNVIPMWTGQNGGQNGEERRDIAIQNATTMNLSILSANLLGKF